MKLKWEYPLPTNEQSRDYHFEGPLCVWSGRACTLSGFEGKAFFHWVELETGKGDTVCAVDGNSVLPKDGFFLPLAGGLLFYNGGLFCYNGENVTRVFSFERGETVRSHTVLGDRLFCATERRLCCFGLSRLELLWWLSLEGESHYSGGNVSLFEGRVACFGQDALLLISPERGEVEERLRLPRIGKLFAPRRAPNGDWILGYTNWSNAGILRYDPVEKKILWREKRNFEGPLLRCRLFEHGEDLLWCKNDTELICVDLEGGAERYRASTRPWLYAEPISVNGGIVFGTSGADGALVCIDGERGEERWSVPLKNGCAFFAYEAGRFYVGDFDKTVKEIDAERGDVLQSLSVGAEVVGSICMSNGKILTMIWGDEVHPVRLICLDR